MATVTLKDVARKAGVSVATVSITLRNGPEAKRFSKETIEHVHDVVKELGYRPNYFASQIRKNSRKIIMLKVTTLQDIAGGITAQSFEQNAAKLGYKTMISVLEGTEKDTFVNNEIIGPHGISALAISARPSLLTDQTICKLASEGVKIVLVGRDIDSRLISRVMIDDYVGATKAAKYVYEQGVSNVWIICRPFISESHKTKRVVGFQDYARQIGCPQPKLVFVSPMPDSYTTALECYKIFRNKLKELGPPEAIFAINDMLIYPVVRALFEAGYKPGEDIATVGYGDLWPSEFMSPTITTVRSPTWELGAVAAELLIDMVENKITNGRKVTLTPELVIRESGHFLRK